MNSETRVFVGGDQQSSKLREDIMKFLRTKEWNCVDLGVFKGDETDYARIKHEVEEKVNFEEPGTLGVLVFGTQKEKPELKKEEEKK